MDLKTVWCSIQVSVVLVLFSAATPAVDQPVGISNSLEMLIFSVGDEEYIIERNPDNANTIAPDYALTSRPCPPFCIQPMQLGNGVETVGELEVIDYLDRLYNQGEDGILVIDSRTQRWVEKGMIPGAVNIPWTALDPKKGASAESIIEILTKQLGVRLLEGKDLFDIDEALTQNDLSTILDFDSARTLVLYCNGMWCGQSPMSIDTLLRFGYPAQKLKWYRGGMQDWQILGLTTILP